MTDILVVGGGPAGAATATLLARGGAAVTLFERDAEPAERICGEFLSHEACLYLSRLGLDPVRLGAAPITDVALVTEDGIARAPLGFAAAGLSRRVLDGALRARAAEAGVRLRLGRPVRAVDARGVECGGRHEAAHVVLATGKHDMPGMVRPGGSDLVGFKLHLRLSPRARDLGEGMIQLMLFPDGYAGLQPIEGGRANLCLMVRKRRLDVAGSWPVLLAELLAGSAALRERVGDAEGLHARPLAVARVPYGFVHRGGGAWRVGDQMAVIPSFSGDGMAMALHTATRAAAALLAGGTAACHHARAAREVGGGVRRAMWLQRLGYVAAGQLAMAGATRAWPGLLTRAAAATRVPRRYL